MSTFLVYIQDDEIEISGTVDDDNDPKVVVYVNDKKVSTGSGDWETTVKLDKGTNSIIVVAENSYGKTTSITKKIVRLEPQKTRQQSEAVKDKGDDDDDEGEEYEDDGEDASDEGDGEDD